MRYGFLSPFLQPQVLFTTNEPQSYVFGGRNHPLHSNSQKLLLQRYVRERGWNEVDTYVDDGYSGTNFQRPGVQRLIADAKAGRINVILVKDLSRFGRNYIEFGQYTEIRFPEMGVRFIAVNDGVDSDDQMGNDFTPFRNLV